MDGMKQDRADESQDDKTLIATIDAEILELRDMRMRMLTSRQVARRFVANMICLAIAFVVIALLRACGLL